MEAAYGFSITIAMMMTTYLLSYFLLFRKKWNKWLVFGILAVFVVIEMSFFVTNVAKIKQRWMFLFFELFIFSVMYIWYYARRLNNRFVHFVELGKYTSLIQELSADETIPKFCTHLVYLSKANLRWQVEERIIKSIFSKKPKRADVYWLLHINRTEEPFTLNYDVSELVENKLIRVTINMGFRVQPRSELYFKKIVQDLINNQELNMHIIADGSTKYNTERDFKFVVIEKFLSVENEFSIREGILLKSYFFLKRMSQSDERAFGLDKSDVQVEQYPLVYTPAQVTDLVRNTRSARYMPVNEE